MVTISAILQIDDTRLAQSIEEASARLESADGEVVLDLSSVGRFDPSAVSALKTLAEMAQQKKVKVVLRGVKVDVYKVLKLAKLSNHFSFVS